MSLTLALLAVVSAVQPLSLAQAKRMPTSALAVRVLGMSGVKMREVELPEERGLFPEHGLTWLRFASAPRSAGFPGLCEADEIYISFEPAGSERTSNAAPMAVDHVSTWKSYRIVGLAGVAPGGWDQAYGRKLEKLCASTVPILGSRTGPGYFSGSLAHSGQLGAVHANFAARALENAQGFTGEAACTPDRVIDHDSLCLNAKGVIARLIPSSLASVQIDRCEDQPQAYCLALIFRRSTEKDDEDQAIELKIKTDAVVLDPPPSTITIRGLAIDAYTFAY